jgi:hypothetical protein
MLLALNDASVDQGELALEDDASLLREAEGPRLMQALDAVNRRYGADPSCWPARAWPVISASGA